MSGPTRMMRSTQFPTSSALGRRQVLLAGVGALTLGLSACSNQPPPPLLDRYPAPRQAPLLQPEIRFLPGGTALVLRARYDITAHVMSVERYSDNLADVAPVDFALAWGAAAEPANQAALLVRQGGRWYRFRGGNSSMTSELAARLSREMANVHMVPANPQVKAALLSVPAGASIRLNGYLVDIRHPDEGYKTTSLSRDDQGAGACEILLVEQLRVMKLPG